MRILKPKWDEKVKCYLLVFVANFNKQFRILTFKGPLIP
jgi:hypothetical protein